VGVKPPGRGDYEIVTSSDADIDRPAGSLTWRTLLIPVSIGSVIALGLMVLKLASDPVRIVERVTIVIETIVAVAALVMVVRIVGGVVLIALRKRVERRAGEGAVVLQIRSSEGMNNALGRVFRSTRPEDLRPWQVNPVLVVDDAGVELWNAGRARTQIDWGFIEGVEIGVAQELGRRHPALVLGVVIPGDGLIPLVFRVQRLGLWGLRSESHPELVLTRRAIVKQRPAVEAT
jgi:hypothetical protein